MPASENRVLHPFGEEVRLYFTGAETGARVHCAKGGVHAFKNTGETPSRMLLTTMPPGFEVFFAKCAAEFARPEGPDMPAW